MLHRYRRSQLVGTLITDPARVGDELNQAIRSGASPRALVLHIPAGHAITAADASFVQRDMMSSTGRIPVVEAARATATLRMAD